MYNAYSIVPILSVLAFNLSVPRGELNYFKVSLGID